MRLLDMFEITVEDGRDDRVLLVVAADEPEARRLARLRGRVKAISTAAGPFAVRGDSRVVGALASELAG